LKKSVAGGAGLYLTSKLGWMGRVYAQIPGGTLDPLGVSRYVTPMLIPPVMPKAGTIKLRHAHPIHIHEVVFEVVNRQAIFVDEEDGTVQVDLDSPATPAEPWETGFKDTVIAYPGQVTRIRAQFHTPGQFVWHCHIVEHEDNEMMRPYRIGPVQPGQPA
jgi:hypothetical protein